MTCLVRARVIEEKKTVDGIEYVLLEIKGETLAGEVYPVQFPFRKSKVAVDDVEDVTDEVINFLEIRDEPAQGEVLKAIQNKED